ncbi:hypothetical protein NEFER03_0620 [Nematocida sp. LUAm3]|nr:hypothetical protein NEFER03_0620 [Nematocida sp. LUAm3]KAI5175587.1 hypothetical protein NEFER02_1493 [Nematocida sp. LUAm2]KAI5178383.1 hypothetical protein NEFER01_1530 [Nematocida sp. LUAm1]
MKEKERSREYESLADIIEKEKKEEKRILGRRYLLADEQPTQTNTMTCYMLKKLKSTLFDTIMPGSLGLSLVYSSEKHGYSLATLIRQAQQGPSRGYFVLSIIESSTTPKEYERVFGAVFLSQLDYQRDSFGCGNTYLFRFITPKSQNTLEEPNSILNVYPAANKDSRFYIISKRDYLAFGCSNAKFGLLIDKKLMGGESNSVDTYNNDVLSHEQRFYIKQIELWHMRM